MCHLSDILIGRAQISSHNTARASDVTVKVNITLILFELKSDC